MINQQWTTTEWTYKEQLKNVLYSYLIEKGTSAPHYLRNKYAKLLVDVAKQDWPIRYPHFFTNILEVCFICPEKMSNNVVYYFVAFKK